MMENLLLLSNVKLGGHTLQNRIAMAPMTRCRAIGNVANALMTEYYVQRAGVGLIITEGVSPSANGLGYARIPGIYTQAQTDSWKPITAAVHAKRRQNFYATYAHRAHFACSKYARRKRCACAFCGSCKGQNVDRHAGYAGQ